MSYLCPELPVEFRADLADTRIACLGDNAEVRAADVPEPGGSTDELRVVEDVEKFKSEIESEILLNYGSL